MVANDVSARDVQFGDGQWVRDKSFDTFCPLGPLLVTREEIPDPQALALRTRVNGEVVQLTPTESRLLYALAANLGQTVTTETLLARGWAETEDADPSYVWVTMRRLRQKVEVNPNKPVYVQTVRGVGYRLVATEPAVGSGG